MTVYYILLLSLFGNVSAGTVGGAVSVSLLTNDVARVVSARSMGKLSAAKQRRIVHLLTTYGRRWHVDPVLAACVAAKESNFRNKPPALTYCKTRIKNGSAVQVCRKQQREEGMMQSVPYQRVTKRGFWFCFGTSRKYSRAALRKTDAGICVGIYELSTRRLWVRRRPWLKPRHHRHRRFLKVLRRKYPRRYTELARMFWAVGTYNWGPKILSYNTRYDAIGYPIKVLKCYLKYSGVQHARSRRNTQKAPGSTGTGWSASGRAGGTGSQSNSADRSSVGRR